MKYINQYGDVAELFDPANEQGFCFPKINGKHVKMRYDDFIAEYRHLPSTQRDNNATSQDLELVR